MVDSGPVPPMRPRVFMEKRSLVIGHFPFELGRYSYLPCNSPWDLEMKNEKWKMTNDFPLPFLLSLSRTTHVTHLILRLWHSHQPLIKPTDDVFKSLDPMPWLS